MLTPDTLALVRAWTPADLTLALRTYQRAHPDLPAAPVSDLNPLGPVALRVLDIFTQRLNAQLAATPLVPFAQADLAARLGALWGNAGLGAEWAAQTPPSVSALNFFLGDILEALESERLPALIVGSSLPGGDSVQRGAVGTLSEDTVSLSVLYVLPYAASREQYALALRGAGAAADLLASYVQDPVTNWLDGKITNVAVNVPRMDQGAPRFILGVVDFSCTAFLPRTRTQA